MASQAVGSSSGLHRRWTRQEPSDLLLKGVRLWIFIENDFSKPPTTYTFFADKNCYFLYAKNDNTKECLFWDMLYISDIRRTKFPSISDQDADDSLDDKIVQLVYRKDGIIGLERVHILASSTEDAQSFMDSVNKLTGNMFAINASPLSFLRKVHFRSTLSANGKGEIPVKTIRAALKVKVNIKDSECPVLATLEPRGCVKATEEGSVKVVMAQDFTFEMFMSIYGKLVNHREDIQKVVEKYSKKRGLYLSGDEFWSFVNDQRQKTELKNELLHPPLKKDEALLLVEKFEPSRPRSGTNTRMTAAGLISFLLSEENSVLESNAHCQCTHDMSAPLNHYYINSSHNTYLTGGQLRSASTVEMYIQVLLLGCRCIELDCWVYHKEVIITHGGTLCTKILFKDVLEAIRDYAFVASDYPVILSIENHVKEEELLNSMATMYTVILGDYLLSEPLPGFPCEVDGTLPSLEKLRRKIIIKDKIRGPKMGEAMRTALPSITEGGEDFNTLERQLKDQPIPSSSTLERNFKYDSPVRVVRSPTADSVASVDDPEIAEPDLDEDLGDDISINELARMARPSEGVALVSQSIIALLNYCTAVKFHCFETFQEQRLANLMFSLDEDKAYTQMQRNPVAFVTYNMRQNSRVYPGASRFSSSNLMPQIFWNAGCQMVALNFQTPDSRMRLNLAKFESNGGTGFLLKPAVFRLPRPKPFHPFVRTPVDNVHPISLIIKVISGQFLADCRVFVEVEVYGLVVDSQRHGLKTRALAGPHPVWGDRDKPFHFKRIILPELAMIGFTVYDEGNQLVGQRILPIETLNGGYRHIVLRDQWNQPIGLPMLCIHTVSKVYIRDDQIDAVEALMDPISHMKKQLRNLYQDLDEDERQLCGQNPNMLLKTSDLISQLRLPKEFMADAKSVVRPTTETLPGILQVARSRREPVATTLTANEIESLKKVKILEQKLKQSDELIRKKFEEKQHQILKKKEKSKQKKSLVETDFDVKLEELRSIEEAKRKVNRIKHEEKIFKLKRSAMVEMHKKELLDLDKMFKKELDDLRLQTSRIAATMKSESKEDASVYAFNKFTRWSNDLKTIHTRERDALKSGQDEAFVKAEAYRPSVTSDNGTCRADEFSSPIDDDVMEEEPSIPEYRQQRRKQAISATNTTGQLPQPVANKFPISKGSSDFGEAQESTVVFTTN